MTSTKMTRRGAARRCVGGHLAGCFLILLASACGFPRPADVEPDATGDSIFQLLALEPDVAAAGDTIVLEGTFGSTLMVNFPDGVSVPATLLGEHRATVVVPRPAITGALSVTTAGVTIGHLTFHRTAFSLDLQPFQASPDQASGGKQEATLVAGRGGAASAVISNDVYVIGGMDSTGYLGSVERARINADGSLGGFSSYPVSLMTPRAGHICVVIGVFVYVIGGTGGTGPLDSIERAMIAPDGSLGQFNMVPGRTLVAARTGSAGVVLGNTLYVIGGSGNGVLGSIERAIIDPNGSLEPFALDPGAVLTTSRTGHTATITGDALYVIGGSSSSGVVGSVERAVIAGDGALGRFASVGQSLDVPRAGHTSIRFGSSLYVLGGVGSSGELASVEQASILADGSIGPFAASRLGSLARARGGSVSVTSPTSLYLLGGTTSDGSYSNRIEHASINAGGVLGTFSTVPGVALAARTANLLGTVVNGSWLHAFTTGMIERARIHDDGTLEGFTAITDGALDPARGDYVFAEIMDKLYIMGGSDATGGDTLGRNVLRATIAPDGSLGPFAATPGVSLVNPHIGARSVVLGDRLYVIGGHAATASVQNTVEVATIGADGSLGSFTNSGPTVGNGCDGCESVVIGKFLYLISGLGQSNIVQRAAINEDSSLGQFAAVPGVSTAAFRGQATALVVGPYLYLLGGSLLSSDDPDMERAPILADGALGAFSALSASVGKRSGWIGTLLGDRCYVLGGSQGFAYTTDVMQAALQ